MNLLTVFILIAGSLYLLHRCREVFGRVIIGLLILSALGVFIFPSQTTQVFSLARSLGWLPREFPKGPFAKAEIPPPVIASGEVIPGQLTPNVPNPKGDQPLPVPQLDGDFKIASSQSGCEVPSVWQRDSYYSASFQRAGCGPASVAMLLISQGFLDPTQKAVKQLAEESLKDGIWSGKAGANGVEALAKLLNERSDGKLNATYKYDVKWVDVQKIVQKAPTIVAILSSEYPYGHYLVVLEINEDFVITNDPYAPEGMDYMRQFEQEKFKQDFVAAGSKLIEIDPVVCGTGEDLNSGNSVNGFDPYSSAKFDCQARVQQTLSQIKDARFVLKALNQNEFDYCSIWALLAGDLDAVLPDYGEEAVPQGKPALGSLGGHPFAKKLSGWLHFGRDFAPGKKEDGSDDKRIFGTQKALVVSKIYIPSSRTDQRVPASQVTEEQRLLGVLLADTGYVLVAAARNGNQAYMSIYGHLKSIEQSSLVGDEFARGSQIGEMGMTGNTLGLHVHYGTAKNPRWQGFTEEDSNGNPVKKLDGWYDPFSGE